MTAGDGRGRVDVAIRISKWNLREAVVGRGEEGSIIGII
jgi:hypothetical protein